ncbi:hypothetical protein BBJ28_00009930 [Nothophytophthora sp. Chile5]|nr:hypothetical protein BBJ28_00009930 [Nothophytophthora sp. Chile5]
MFASRSAKPKKNKRRRVAETEDEQAASGRSDSRDDGDLSVAPVATDRRKVNMFSTGGVKKAKNVVQTRLIESEREIVPQQYAGDATYETQIDTQKDRDARAVMERSIKANADGSAELESGKVYRGQAAYKNYITKKESQIGMNKYTGTQGPIRAQTWARAISRFDYQPDICKDYKETGFCGYGDSCKFLHDRGDYKSGWQIEKEYAEKEKKRQQRLQEGRGACACYSARQTLSYGPLEALQVVAYARGPVACLHWPDPDEVEDEDDDKYVIKSDDEEQFACTICRGPFRNASAIHINAYSVHVGHFFANSCGHFFCEACALKHFKKTPRCFNCKKQTNGAHSNAKRMLCSLIQLVQIVLTLTFAWVFLGVFNAAEKLRTKEQEGLEEETEEEGKEEGKEDVDAAGQAEESESGGWTKVAVSP